jgi:hypothetical protein
MTPKDIAILTALDSYRYLDTEQIAALILSSKRTCQMRLKSLRESSMIIRWLTIEPPGWIRRQSVVVLAERGARLLARQTTTSPWPGVRRARDAVVYSAQLSHDLEANGFLIALAIAGAADPDEGVHQWIGEDSCRRAYRERGEHLAPDGWGRYLTSEREITFFLEWDRATASPMRISEKARTYVRHFLGRTQAAINNVLFVSPSARRELSVNGAIARALPTGTRPCCRFWTTNADRLKTDGYLGEVWTAVDEPDQRPASLREMGGSKRSDRLAVDCIAKPQWWERRPGGGERE